MVLFGREAPFVPLFSHYTNKVLYETVHIIKCINAYLCVVTFSLKKHHFTHVKQSYCRKDEGKTIGLKNGGVPTKIRTSS